MTRKSFVIDTNVLLHDPDAIKKFKDNDVIVPLAVLEELDSMKRLSDELGKNARHVMRYIDSLKNLKKGDLNTGIPIENGIVVKVHVELKPPEKKNISSSFRPCNK
jgi:PhoH-like ATPase